MGRDSTAGLRVPARLRYTRRVQLQSRQRHVSQIAVLLVLLSCGRGQTRDQADFWQEALPEPIAVLDPWLSTPVSNKVRDDEWVGHVLEITPFVEGPQDATGAEHTVHMRDASSAERHLHLRLGHGAALPLFRNEAVKVRTFARLGEDGTVQRSLIVSARRPLGTGADFKPVVIVSRYDDLIPQDALPHVLKGMTRTEQLAYREALKGEGDCTQSTSHYFVTTGVDLHAVAAPNRRRVTYPPGAHIRRQEGDANYDVTLHDARRTSLAPCPVPDQTALIWSAVWAEVDAKLIPKPLPPILEPLPLPQAPTPTHVPGAAPVHKPRKAHEAPVHEHLAPRP